GFPYSGDYSWDDSLEDDDSDPNDYYPIHYSSDGYPNPIHDPVLDDLKLQEKISDSKTEVKTETESPVHEDLLELKKTFSNINNPVVVNTDILDDKKTKDNEKSVLALDAILKLVHTIRCLDDLIHDIREFPENKINCLITENQSPVNTAPNNKVHEYVSPVPDEDIDWPNDFEFTLAVSKRLKPEELKDNKEEKEKLEDNKEKLEDNKNLETESTVSESTASSVSEKKENLPLFSFHNFQPSPFLSELIHHEDDEEQKPESENISWIFGQLE
ncbi:hypothetical protein ALC56_01309, partial [Trachymyrmex septentrionalis]